jgi:hypothetical protein
VPVLSAVTSNIEKGLSAAEKLSDFGIRPINLGEKASKTRSLGGASRIVLNGVVGLGDVVADRARRVLDI